jgi:hypothetical protein
MISVVKIKDPASSNQQFSKSAINRNELLEQFGLNGIETIINIA